MSLERPLPSLAAASPFLEQKEESNLLEEAKKAAQKAKSVKLTRGAIVENRRKEMAEQADMSDEKIEELKKEVESRRTDTMKIEREIAALKGAVAEEKAVERAQGKAELEEEKEGAERAPLKVNLEEQCKELKKQDAEKRVERALLKAMLAAENVGWDEAVKDELSRVVSEMSRLALENARNVLREEGEVVVEAESPEILAQLKLRVEKLLSQLCELQDQEKSEKNEQDTREIGKKLEIATAAKEALEIALNAPAVEEFIKGGLIEALRVLGKAIIQKAAEAGEANAVPLESVEALQKLHKLGSVLGKALKGGESEVLSKLTSSMMYALATTASNLLDLQEVVMRKKRADEDEELAESTRAIDEAREIARTAVDLWLEAEGFPIGLLRTFCLEPETVKQDEFELLSKKLKQLEIAPGFLPGWLLEAYPELFYSDHLLQTSTLKIGAKELLVANWNMYGEGFPCGVDELLSGRDDAFLRSRRQRVADRLTHLNPKPDIITLQECGMSDEELNSWFKDYWMERDNGVVTLCKRATFPEIEVVEDNAEIRRIRGKEKGKERERLVNGLVRLNLTLNDGNRCALTNVHMGGQPDWRNLQIGDVLKILHRPPAGADHYPGIVAGDFNRAIVGEDGDFSLTSLSPQMRGESVGKTNFSKTDAITRSVSGPGPDGDRFIEVLSTKYHDPVTGEVIEPAQQFKENHCKFRDFFALGGLSRDYLSLIKMLLPEDFQVINTYDQQEGKKYIGFLVPGVNLSDKNTHEWKELEGIFAGLEEEDFVVTFPTRAGEEYRIYISEDLIKSKLNIFREDPALLTSVEKINHAIKTLKARAPDAQSTQLMAAYAQRLIQTLLEERIKERKQQVVSPHVTEQLRYLADVLEKIVAGEAPENVLKQYGDRARMAPSHWRTFASLVAGFLACAAVVAAVFVIAAAGIAYATGGSFVDLALSMATDQVISPFVGGATLVGSAPFAFFVTNSVRKAAPQYHEATKIIEQAPAVQAALGANEKGADQVSERAQPGAYSH